MINIHEGALKMESNSMSGIRPASQFILPARQDSNQPTLPGRQGSRSQRPGSVLSKSPAQRFWGQVRTALYALSLFR